MTVDPKYLDPKSVGSFNYWRGKWLKRKCAELIIIGPPNRLTSAGMCSKHGWWKDGPTDDCPKCVAKRGGSK